MSINLKKFSKDRSLDLFVLISCMIIAFFVLYLAVVIGIFAFSFLGLLYHWPSNVSDYYFKASDFVGYYLQILLAIVAIFLFRNDCTE